MFTQFKYSPAQVSQAAADLAKAVAADQPGANAAQVAADAIAQRLREHPERYVHFGPYWWSVKDALRSLGHDLGAADDVVLRAEYGGNFPAYGALVAGEQFRDYYLQTYLDGSTQFWLDDQAEQSFVLFDVDMEVRRLGGSARVVADVSPTVEAGESLLDAAVAQPLLDAAWTPYPVKFEHEAALWTATVYAADSEAARVKVGALERRLMGAIEASKRSDGAMLDSVDARPMYVDRAARQVFELAPTAGAMPPA